MTDLEKICGYIIAADEQIKELYEIKDYYVGSLCRSMMDSGKPTLEAHGYRFHVIKRQKIKRGTPSERRTNRWLMANMFTPYNFEMKKIEEGKGAA